jgi:hypothetical protein
MTMIEFGSCALAADRLGLVPSEAVAALLVVAPIGPPPGGFGAPSTTGIRHA